MNFRDDCLRLSPFRRYIPCSGSLTAKEKEGRKEENVLFNDVLNTFYLRLYGRKEGNVSFNDALNTFYLRLYGVGHMVKDHSDSEIKPASITWVTLSDTAKVLLYAPSHRQDSLCYTSRGALAGTRNRAKEKTQYCNF